MASGLGRTPQTNATDRFKDKVVIITGGAGNIGSSVAHRMAKEGCNIAVFDLPKLNEQMEEMKVEFEEKYSVKFIYCGCDVTNEESVIESVNTVVKELGKIDYLFNNAGYQGLFVPTDKYPSDDFNLVMNINVTGVFHVLKAVVGHMVEAGQGSIVQTASMAGVSVPPNMLAYATSKAAVIGMTKTAAKDLAPKNIRVNCISPAFIGPGMMWTRQTELQAAAGSQYYDADPKVVEQQMIGAVPMRRFGSLDEVANVVTFLLSDDASYLTAQNIEITGGIN